MLYRELLSKELAARRDDFSGFSERQVSDVDIALQSLRSVFSDSSAREKINGTQNPGAIPTREVFDTGSFGISFAASWENHEESREWAENVLSKRVTFAADGSQLFLLKETSLPVGAVQIGWFENPHDPDKKYDRSASFEVLSPKMLLENQDEPLNPETRVGERRVHLEIERAAQFLSKHKGWQERGERMPLAFFDGTLLVSFSQPQTSVQPKFLAALLKLVELSKDCRVPLVGYVDRSFAKDVVKMVSVMDTRIAESSIYDTTLLSTETTNNVKVLSSWGDRTSFCLAKRHGLEVFNDPDNGLPMIGFCYLQTTSEAGPARLDIPRWIFEGGLLDEVIDVVRAECVIGLGYPYALETADATALISRNDRDVFVAALAEFAGREGLEFAVSRKNASKARRR